MTNDTTSEGTTSEGTTSEGTTSEGTTSEGTTPNDTIPEGTNAAGPSGVGRLKHAGVGPTRTRGPQPKARLSGADVTALGSLEAEILGLLWRIGRPATGMEVMEASLYARRAQGQEPASFATIATTLRRLSDKGVLSNEKERGRTPIYAPLVGREEMAARILDNVSRTLLGRPLHGLLPRLLGGLRPTRPGEAAPEDAGAEEEVRRLLRALEEAAGEGETAEKGPGAAGEDRS